MHGFSFVGSTTWALDILQNGHLVLIPKISYNEENVFVMSRKLFEKESNKVFFQKLMNLCIAFDRGERIASLLVAKNHLLIGTNANQVYKYNLSKKYMESKTVIIPE